MTAKQSASSATHSAALRNARRGRAGRLIIVILGLVACVWEIWSSGQEGISTLLFTYASTTNQIDAAENAIRLSPSSPAARYVRAGLLSNAGRSAEAIEEYERAVALRPHDYVLWFELGRARDQASDVDGAAAAFRESTRLAPFYAKPHWQLGNTLFRAGRIDEAFAELRRAVTSNPKLMPQAIGLAWAAFSGNAPAVEQVLQPQTQSAHLALAGFFASHGSPTESIAQFRAAGAPSEEQRRALLADLLAAKSFLEAFEVWSSGRPANGTASPRGIGTIANGGFEEPITIDDPGFGWQPGRDLHSVRISLDNSEPLTGAYCLRLDWSGESDPSTPVISQLVLVEPKTRYRLSFAARTQELLTIGLPYVMVTDAGDDKKTVLMQSRTLPQGTTGWQDYLSEFSTSETTRAVTISIRRETCNIPQCAVFGHVWFDKFSIERL